MTDQPCPVDAPACAHQWRDTFRAPGRIEKCHLCGVERPTPTYRPALHEVISLEAMEEIGLTMVDWDSLSDADKAEAWEEFGPKLIELVSPFIVESTRQAIAEAAELRRLLVAAALTNANGQIPISDESFHVAPTYEIYSEERPPTRMRFIKVRRK